MTTTTEPDSDHRNLLFSWPDYVVFAISLALPLAIGVFFFLYKRKEQSTSSFLVGDRKMNFVAVAMSIMASLMSGMFVVGKPAEIHYFGIEYMYMAIGVLIGILFSAHLCVPIFHRMKFTSAYEYLERRFNYPTRILASVIFCLSTILILGAVLYIPSLAFSQVTSIDMFVTIAIAGVICTVYSTIGGIKAVVWTDAFQVVVLLVGMIALTVLGSARVGGSDEVWRIAREGGRTKLDDFSPDPRNRYTFWSQTIGMSFTAMVNFMSNQIVVQRYMTVSSTRRAQASLYLCYILYIPLVIMISYVGLALYANYASCDPAVSGDIKTSGQIVAYYIMDVMGEYYGIPGLILAAIFAAALSTLSSQINSLSAVCLEDFISPAYAYFKGVALSDRVRHRIAIGLVLGFGCLTVGLSMATSLMTTSIVQTFSVLGGIVGPPIAGVFIMGLFIPGCNSAGAISGMLIAMAFSMWIGIGRIMHPTRQQTLPIGLCGRNQTISPPRNSTAAVTEYASPVLELYRISFTWYSFIGVVSCIIVGVIVSLLSGGFKKSNRARVDPSLMNINCCRTSPGSSSSISKDPVETDSDDKSVQVLSYKNIGYVDDDTQFTDGKYISRTSF